MGEEYEDYYGYYGREEEDCRDDDGQPIDVNYIYDEDGNPIKEYGDEEV